MSSLPESPHPEKGVDPGSALAGRRDAVLRRWLGMEVERATVSDLAERPLSTRLRELEELFDAALHELSSLPVGDDSQLHEELREALARHGSIGVPFTLALLGAPDGDPAGWRRALTQAAEEGSRVVDAGDGIAAVILPGVTPAEADPAVDRLRALAWSSNGCQGRLPGAARASCPQDGDTPDALLSVARDQFRRLSEREPQHRPFEAVPGPGSVTPLYPEYS
jgi:hypothetical protein